MSKEQQVTLTWKGPFRIGTLPISEENESTLIGVYATLQHYPNTKTPNHCVSYVGKSTDIWKRIQSHYQSFLSFDYFLRHDDGEKYFDPGTDDKFEYINKIDDGVSLQDIKRILVYYSDISNPSRNGHDIIGPTECILIHAVMAKADNESSVKCDNGNRGSYGNYPHDLQIINEFPDGDSYLRNILGDHPIRSADYLSR